MPSLDDQETPINGRRLNGQTLFYHGMSLLLGAVLTLSGLALTNRTRPAAIIIEAPPPTHTPAPSPSPAPIQVYVSGAVVAPDVYALPAESLLRDLIMVAGGLTKDAPVGVINLAQPLNHGQHIHIPAAGETAMQATTAQSPEMPPASSGFESGQININTATIAELDTLPGIGPTTAQQIINYRSANGPFATVEEVLQVPGIGPSKLAQIEPLVTVR